jgi:hypothetical protein
MFSEPPRESFDIFRLESQNPQQLVATAKSFDGALFEVELLAAKSPGLYLIRNPITGERHTLTLGPKTLHLTEY